MAHGGGPHATITWPTTTIPPTTTTTICREIEVNHCCPVGYEWDKTFRCCMPSTMAVRKVEMHDPTYMETPDPCGGGGTVCRIVNYCEEKEAELGQKCSHGEGPCRLMDDCGNRINQCEPGLNCTFSDFAVTDWESACCNPGETYNGRECLAQDEDYMAPWLARWTRSRGTNIPMGPVLNQTGGGPIVIHIAAGATIPNGTEAAGWDAIHPTSPYYDQRYESALWRPQQCKYLRGESAEYCFYGMGAWPYRTPPSPIWFEARNIGPTYHVGSKNPNHADNKQCLRFAGFDSTVTPFHPGKADTISPQVPIWIDCLKDDCNVGRDIDGTQDPYLSTNGYCSVYSTQPTSCERGSTPPSDPHECNDVPKGYGSFTHFEDAMKDGGPVNPYDVSAWSFVPEACGRLQRKEVINRGGFLYPDSHRGYPKEPSAGIAANLPHNELVATVTELREDGTTVNRVEELTVKDQPNAVGSPPDPWTVLNYYNLDHELLDTSRYLKIDSEYTVENEIVRQPMVKQCMWDGCSRKEEDVIAYTRTYIPSLPGYKHGAYSCTTNTYTGLPWAPPNCCTGGSSTCNAVCKKKLDDGSWDIQNVEYYDDCTCEFHCWGCWHFVGQTFDYPVSSAPGETDTVYEYVHDKSTVESNTYGVNANDQPNLRIENPMSFSNSEVDDTIGGALIYGVPDVKSAMGYITIHSQDAESRADPSKKPIDMLSGFSLAIGDEVYIQVFMKKFPFLHDLTVLQSTLPREYQFQQDTPEIMTWTGSINLSLYIMNLTTECMKSGSTYTATGPTYFKWLRNPSKKFYYFHDKFMAAATKYSWDMPIFLVDRHDYDCNQLIYERAHNVGLFRNYHEDEPRYYDHALLYMLEEDVEQDLPETDFDTDTFSNIENKRKKEQTPLKGVYLRYAPDCEDADVAAEYSDKCSIAAHRVAGDCEYTSSYMDQLPIPLEACESAYDWVYSDPFRCDRLPGKYKSYCQGGQFHAYWLDTFIYRYKWDTTLNDCVIEYVDDCTPKAIDPRTYVLIFEPSSTITQWNNSQLTLYHNFRSYTIDPFGPHPAIEEDHVIVHPNIHLDIKKPKPYEYYLEGQHVEGQDNLVLTVKRRDFYGPPASIPDEKVLILFKGEHADKSNKYSVDDTITLDVRSGNDVGAEIKGVADNSFMQTRQQTQLMPVYRATRALDVVWSSLWVIVVAYAAAMSYRFFSGRSMDFKDMWDEYKGKK
ncbi:MAG: hypothetical protein KKD39_05355 [Candidatus Altiarchaeota archaeon]|nr:hypothetical protein [Candidatus Altiarchaeota archaeon]